MRLLWSWYLLSRCRDGGVRARVRWTSGPSPALGIKTRLTSTFISNMLHKPHCPLWTSPTISPTISPTPSTRTKTAYRYQSTIVLSAKQYYPPIWSTLFSLFCNFPILFSSRKSPDPSPWYDSLISLINSKYKPISFQLLVHYRSHSYSRPTLSIYNKTTSQSLSTTIFITIAIFRSRSTISTPPIYLPLYSNHIIYLSLLILKFSLLIFLILSFILWT